MGYFKWHVPYYYPRRRTALLNNMFTNIDRDYTNTHYYIDSMAYGRQARLQNSPVTSIVGICTSILHMESTNLESCSSFPTTSPRLIMISVRLQMNIASQAQFCRTEQNSCPAVENSVLISWKDWRTASVAHVIGSCSQAWFLCTSAEV